MVVEAEDFGSLVPAGTLRSIFGKRLAKTPADFELPMSYTDAFSGPAYALLTITASDHAQEPRTVAESSCSGYWGEWEAAMDKALIELCANGTWELVTPPKGASIVTSKWFLRSGWQQG